MPTLDSWLGWVALIACLVIPTAIIMWLMSWFDSRKSDRFIRELHQLEERLNREIGALSVEEARLRAEALLADPSRFACTPAAEAEDWRLQPLAPLVREFFEKYESVEDPDKQEGSWWEGRFSLSRSQIAQCRDDPRFLQIGRYGGDEDLEEALAVKPGEEAIYFAYEGESFEDVPSRFPTIYHYLLYADQTRLWWRRPAART